MEKNAGRRKARKRDGGFKLDGKKFDTSCTPKTIKAVLALLSKLRKGQLLTTGQLREQLGFSRKGFFNVTAKPKLVAYRQTVRFPSRMVVWGSKATITDLRKHKEILA